jgi:hypothetical protein
MHASCYEATTLQELLQAHVGYVVYNVLLLGFVINVVMQGCAFFLHGFALINTSLGVSVLKHMFCW